jgi:hypothetical protein
MNHKQPSAPGAAYVAVVRLTSKDRTVLADVGASCERVPAASLTWLIDQGLIAPLFAGGKAGT